MDRFESLSRWLVEHNSLWRCSPFVESAAQTPVWANQFPQIWDAIHSLDESQVVSFKANDAELFTCLKSAAPDLTPFAYFVDVPKPTTAAHTSMTESMCVGMPGNKRVQIEYFMDLLPSNHTSQQWLEWCAGKGYLGRAIASSYNQPVTSLEWQSGLVEAGQAFSNQHALGMSFHQQDVFDRPATSQYMNPTQHCVALHACGDLHVELINSAAACSARSLSIAPCCYHLTRSAYYSPLSMMGKRNDLRLSKADLRIPLQQTVTGGERVTRHRQLEMQFRLGFDELLREEFDCLEQTTVPSIKKSQLEQGFESFCLWAADKKEIPLPSGLDFERYQKKGVQRFWHMERLSLAQQLFQRPLEIWLALDKCHYLTEMGYQVTLQQFCDRSITPRNLFIQAIRA